MACIHIQVLLHDPFSVAGMQEQQAHLLCCPFEVTSGCGVCRVQCFGNAAWLITVSSSLRIASQAAAQYATAGLLIT